MTVTSLLDEYNLSIDDVRWYLSRLLTESLLTHADDPESLARRIWSGTLEAELYNMEEAFVERLTDELSRGITDEQAVRDQLERARVMKIQRGSQ
jgi:hypothetical protein